MPTYTNRQPSPEELATIRAFQTLLDGSGVSMPPRYA